VTLSIISPPFRALEDAVDVAGRAATLVEEIRPIRDQSASINILAFVVHRRQLVLGGKRADRSATIGLVSTALQGSAYQRGAASNMGNDEDLVLVPWIHFGR
jgi:hypothetical protein